MVSPLANLPRSASPSFWPSQSQMDWASCGWDEPEKICVWRILYRTEEGILHGSGHGCWTEEWTVSEKIGLWRDGGEDCVLLS